MQLGAVFDVIRQDLLNETSRHICTAHDLATISQVDSFESGVLLVTDLEQFAATGSHATATLGNLRISVDLLLDNSVDVCLVSRAPRCAYRPVPGSSVLDDSAPFILRLLEKAECPEAARNEIAWNVPAVGLADPPPSLAELLTMSLSELGSEVLAALDHALYEVGAPQDFLDHLDAREVEAIRGAGLAARDAESGTMSFAVPRRLSEFRSALADALAATVEPPVDLADVSSGLWQIEKSIRLKLRDFAVSTFGNRWRTQILHGDLAGKVLGRARADAAVTARSVSELRDPIEWLSVGELLQVVTHSSIGGLGQDAILWDKFATEIVPIRNRLSHMRLIKKGDRETVLMWASRIGQIL